MIPVNLEAVFNDCVRRKSTKAQLVDFLNRCERQFIHNAPMLATISDLRKELGQ
jgi:hypothetical protein